MAVVHMWQKSSKKFIYSGVTGLQSPTLLKIKIASRGLHCMKNDKIWAFRDLYFPAFGQIL